MSSFHPTTHPGSSAQASTCHQVDGAGAIGGFVGTISFVVLQCLGCAGWIFVNVGVIHQIAPFDPFPFPLLSAITSLEAVLLTAFVLIKQNRMRALSRQLYRARIDGQISPCVMAPRRLLATLQ